jgi:hypothetical protein
MVAPPQITVQPLRSAGLDLEPLRVDHAAEAAVVFDDERLHRYIGGAPAGEEELRQRYAQQVAGRSSDGRELWLNWMVRHRASGALVGVPAGLGVRLAGDRVFSCSHERHTAALQSRVVVSAVFWDDSVLVREGRRCSAHHRCLAASRHKADCPPARRWRSARGSAQGSTKESTVLLREPVAGLPAVPGDPPTAHRPGTAADHPPRRTRRGNAQPVAPGEVGQSEGYRSGARSRRTGVPARILSTPAGSQDGTYTVREFVAGSRFRRKARVPQFVGSRGLRIRVLSCGDAYWRVFRACHYTLRWPE